MDRDAGGLEDGARVLARPDRDFARGAIDVDDDVAGARHERGQLVARRGAVGGQGDRGTERRGVGEDGVGGGGGGPQGARLAVDGHRVGLRGAHDDGVALAHDVADARLNQVGAADAHARHGERVADGVAPRGDGARHAVHFEHDGRVRGGDADSGDAEDAGRGEGRHAQNDARRGRESTHVSAQDVQGAGRGGAQRSAQVVAHDTPGYSIWVLLVSLA